MATMFAARRTVLAGLGAMVLAACSGNVGADTAVGPLSDKVLGSEDAPVELVEYASVTCGACAAFHRDVVPTIKEMVDEGRVRFVFREFPTAPTEVAVAGFAAARCAADDDAYYAMLDDMFANQQSVLAASRNGTVRIALQTIAGRHGVDAEAFDSCLSNPDIREAIANATEQGRVDGVTGTPTLFLNGRLLDGGEGRTVESLTELVDAIAPKPEG